MEVIQEITIDKKGSPFKKPEKRSSQEINLLKEIKKLQEVARKQELKYFEISKEKDSFESKCKYFEKKEKERRDEDYNLKNQWHVLEENLMKMEEDNFYMKIIKEKYEQNREKLNQMEKNSFTQKIKIKDLENDLLGKQSEIDDLKIQIQSTEKKKKTALEENTVLKRERIQSVSYTEVNKVKLEMQKQIQILSEEIEQKNEQIKEMKLQGETQLLDLSEDLQNKCNEINQIMQENFELKQQLEKIKDQYEDYKHEQVQKFNEIDYQQQIDLKDHKIQGMQLQIESLKEEFDLLNTHYQNIDESYKEEIQQLEQEIEQSKGLNGQIIQQKEINELLKLHLIEKETTVEQLKKDNEQYLGINQELSKKLKSLGLKQSNQSTNLQDRSQDIQNLQEQLLQTQSIIIQKDAQLQQLNREIQAQTLNNSKLVEEIKFNNKESTKKQISQIEQGIIKILSSLKDMEGSSKMKSGCISSFFNATEFKEPFGEKSELFSIIKELENENNSNQRRYSKDQGIECQLQNEEFDEIIAENEELNLDLQKKNQQIFELKDKNMILDQVNYQKQKEVSDLKYEILQLSKLNENYRKELKEKIEFLNEELGKTLNEKIYKENQIYQLEMENKNLFQKIQYFNELIQRFNKEFLNYRNEVARLQNASKYFQDSRTDIDQIINRIQQQNVLNAQQIQTKISQYKEYAHIIEANILSCKDKFEVLNYDQKVLEQLKITVQYSIQRKDSIVDRDILKKENERLKNDIQTLQTLMRSSQFGNQNIQETDVWRNRYFQLESELAQTKLKLTEQETIKKSIEQSPLIQKLSSKAFDKQVTKMYSTKDLLKNINVGGKNNQQLSASIDYKEQPSKQKDHIQNKVEQFPNLNYKAQTGITVKTMQSMEFGKYQQDKNSQNDFTLNPVDSKADFKKHSQNKPSIAQIQPHVPQQQPYYGGFYSVKNANRPQFDDQFKNFRYDQANFSKEQLRNITKFDQK